MRTNGGNCTQVYTSPHEHAQAHKPNHRPETNGAHCERPYTRFDTVAHGHTKTGAESREDGPFAVAARRAPGPYVYMLCCAHSHTRTCTCSASTRIQIYVRNLSLNESNPEPGLAGPATYYTRTFPFHVPRAAHCPCSHGRCTPLGSAPKPKGNKSKPTSQNDNGVWRVALG